MLAVAAQWGSAAASASEWCGLGKQVRTDSRVQRMFGRKLLLNSLPLLALPSAAGDAPKCRASLHSSVVALARRRSAARGPRRRACSMQVVKVQTSIKRRPKQATDRRQWADWMHDEEVVRQMEKAALDDPAMAELNAASESMAAIIDSYSKANFLDERKNRKYCELWVESTHRAAHSRRLTRARTTSCPQPRRNWNNGQSTVKPS